MTVMLTSQMNAMMTMTVAMALIVLAIFPMTVAMTLQKIVKGCNDNNTCGHDFENVEIPVIFTLEMDKSNDNDCGYDFDSVDDDCDDSDDNCDSNDNDFNN